MYTMIPEEKYLFDLEGYLVIRDVLTAEDVATLNAVSDRVFPRDYQDENVHKGRRGFRHVRFVSRWDVACQNLIDHAVITPYLVDLIGPKFRIDHDYAIFMEKDADGSTLHGMHEAGGHRYYHYQNGVMRNGLMVVTFFLSDARKGDGGFVCIPGSHKSNLAEALPEEVRRLEKTPHYVIQPEVRAGDAVIFTEALCHGTMRWSADQERRVFLFKYNPGHTANHAMAYHPDDYVNPTEQQRRIMAPPSMGPRPNSLTATG